METSGLNKRESGFARTRALPESTPSVAGPAKVYLELECTCGRPPLHTRLLREFVPLSPTNPDDSQTMDDWAVTYQSTLLVLIP